jgi:hypothetical protein
VIRLLVSTFSRDYRLCLLTEALDRPHYAYCMYQGALLAKKLGHKRISVIEFGVAGGGGLVNLEQHASKISKLLAIEIELYGFDSAAGLPEPVDYRDLPYHWKKGFFQMNLEELQSKLKFSRLIIGDVRHTIRDFAETQRPAPVAAIMFDLDFYSSTKAALDIFNIRPCYYLPRVYCYFDDILGGPSELYNDHTGALLAIREFNEAQPTKKLDRARYLVSTPLPSRWCYKIYILHDFSHEAYNTFTSKDDQQLVLQPSAKPPS